MDPSGRHNRRGALARKKHIGVLQTDTQTGALASTKTDLDPPGRHSRRGALASTKEVGNLQADTTDKVH